MINKLPTPYLIHIGALSYTNSLPFFWPFVQKKIPCSARFTFGHPTEINTLLDNGNLDIGLISSANFIANRDKYILLTNYGIGAKERVMSVRLYFRNSIQDLHKKKLLVPSASATSVLLLKILCHKYWQISPEFIVSTTYSFHKPDVEAYSGFLLIGDECLKNIDVEGYHSIDLAQAWHINTKKPFVFALFATRCDTWKNYPEEVRQFHRELLLSFEWSQQHLNEIIAEAKKMTGLPTTILEKYYETIEYQLDSRHFESLELFSQLYYECNIK